MKLIALLLAVMSPQGCALAVGAAGGALVTHEICTHPGSASDWPRLCSMKK